MANVKRPKYVFFDLGNVLLSFDHGQACRQLATVLNGTSERVFEFLFSSGLELKYEEGLITTQQLVEKFEDEFKWSGDRTLLSHAAADIFSVNSDAVALVRELRAAGACPLGILSNTNEIHFEFIKARYSFVHDFDHWILSYEVTAMKPYSKIFEIACSKVGVKAQDCFFVDDMRANVEGGKAAGLDAVLFQGANKLREDFMARGLL